MIESSRPGQRGLCKRVRTFSQPETCFPILCASSQREGGPKTPFAGIQNMVSRMILPVDLSFQEPLCCSGQLKEMGSGCRSSFLLCFNES
jgi:hypothetical protein